MEPVARLRSDEEPEEDCGCILVPPLLLLETADREGARAAEMEVEVAAGNTGWKSEATGVTGEAVLEDKGGWLESDELHEASKGPATWPASVVEDMLDQPAEQCRWRSIREL